MASPTARVLEAETETDRLAQAEADSATFSKLQGELMASGLEVSGAPEETVRFQGLLRRAKEALANARVSNLEAGAARRDAEIVTLQALITLLRAKTLRASLSWCISAPVRVVGRLIRDFVATRPGLHYAIRRLAAFLRRAEATASPPPAPAPPGLLPGPLDSNACSIFQGAPLLELPPDEAEGVVTLGMLYHLSRSL
jgi:hypothetical protein